MPSFFPRLLLAVSLAIATALIPASADARSPSRATASPEFRGVVTGSPYDAGRGRVAIPVTFSKQSARKNRLKSPVGVIILQQTQSITTPDAMIAPVGLRMGDRDLGIQIHLSWPLDRPTLGIDRDLGAGPVGTPWAHETGTADIS